MTADLDATSAEAEASDAQFQYADLILLTRHMADDGYDADSVADAVEKPWKYADELQAARDAIAYENALRPRALDVLTAVYGPGPHSEAGIEDRRA